MIHFIFLSKIDVYQFLYVISIIYYEYKISNKTHPEEKFKIDLHQLQVIVF